MNTGFGNLATLKGYVLAANLQPATDYDAALTAIGLGVYAAIEKYCNRKFMYQANWQDVFSADHCEFPLSRYPVIAPITTVEFKQDEPTGWVVQDQTQLNGTNLVIQSLDAQTGIVSFPDSQDCGIWFSQMRFTYTGGFFWEQLEPNAPGYPTVQPAGSTALPNDLQLAWLIQCAEVWKKKDKLGEGVTTDGSGNESTPEIKLLTIVKQMLTQYIRYSFV